MTRPPILAVAPSAGLMACVGYHAERPNASARAALTRVLDALDIAGPGDPTVTYAPCMKYAPVVWVQTLTPEQVKPFLAALGLSIGLVKFHNAIPSDRLRTFDAGPVRIFVQWPTVDAFEAGVIP